MTKKAHVLREMAAKLEKDYTHNTGQDVVSVLRGFSEALSQIDKLRQNPDPYDSDTAHKAKLHRVGKTAKDRYDVIERRVYAKWGTRREQLINRITEIADLSPKNTDAEVREVLRNMEPSARHEAIQTAIQNKDSTVLSALANGNSLLTGVTDDARNHFLHHYKSKVAPNEMAEFEANEQLIEDAKSVLDFSREAILEVQDQETIAEAEKRKAKNAEIQNEINRLMTQTFDEPATPE